jgi:hypothetical protein
VVREICLTAVTQKQPLICTEMQPTIQPHASSFRDPSGFVFERNGVLYRQVNKIFKDDFDHFINSGCYDHFVKNKWLVPHEEVAENLSGSDNWYRTLKPKRIPFISYPYEWSFDMIKDAALLTLHLAKEGIKYGVMLKDATPYNVQWSQGKPIFIDTISFEKYDSSKPWIAYRQFCENFVSPLVLMFHRSQPLQPMLLAYPDGIPLTITKSLLPWRSFFFFYTYLHVHLHSKWSTRKTANTPVTRANFSEKKMVHILDSLMALVQKKKWKDKPTTWNQYYEEAVTRGDYVVQKKEIIRQWLSEIEFSTAVDLGANTGAFSYLLAEKNVPVVAIDSDHSAINKLFVKVKNDRKDILPLVIDLANPSPAIGLNNTEHASFIERIQVDLGLALALVHHLSIGRNIPFVQISELFKKMTNYLIVEFIPKEDDKVQLMLKEKKDVYYDYNEEKFLAAFSNDFNVRDRKEIPGSKRILYLMKKIA